MSVEIVQRDNDFLLLGGTDDRLQLKIGCHAQLEWYNRQPNAHRDFELYRAFANANDEGTLDGAIQRLYEIYLQPNFGRHILQTNAVLPYAVAIRETSAVVPTDSTSVNAICARLEHWQTTLGLTPSSTISLSKLLHFLKRDSFWIIDSRVMTILKMWGFEGSYRGFGRFLRSLSTQSEWANLLEFLRSNDTDPQNRQGWNEPSTPFLKLLDKVLWW